MREESADTLSDPRWAGVKWTVYRGKAYELTPDFMARHPGGEALVNLAIGRECGSCARRAALASACMHACRAHRSPLAAALPSWPRGPTHTICRTPQLHGDV